MIALLEANEVVTAHLRKIWPDRPHSSSLLSLNHLKQIFVGRIAAHIIEMAVPSQFPGDEDGIIDVIENQMLAVFGYTPDGIVCVSSGVQDHIISVLVAHVPGELLYNALCEHFDLAPMSPTDSVVAFRHWICDNLLRIFNAETPSSLADLTGMFAESCKIFNDCGANLHFIDDLKALANFTAACNGIIVPKGHWEK